MVTPVEFGRRLRELREARGAIQEDVAEAADVSQGLLSLVENGKSGIPNAAAVHRMEDFLRVYHGYLTEPEDRRQKRRQAIKDAVAKYGANLGITDTEAQELDWRTGSLVLGDEIPEMVLLRLIDLIRTPGFNSGQGHPDG